MWPVISDGGPLKKPGRSAFNFFLSIEKGTINIVSRILRIKADVTVPLQMKKTREWKSQLKGKLT